MKFDVIVPFHIKDDKTIEWCLIGIKQLPEVDNIIVVSNKKYRRRIEDLGVIFFDEDCVVEGLTAQTVKNGRWGWYFQQILKLGMADWVESHYYLVVDADTVFLRPIVFFNENQKPLYAFGSEYHKPYFTTFEQLLNFKANREYSFISHHMIFNKSLVVEMRNKFVKESTWYETIISLAKSSETESLFSEYETYGHYIKKFHPEELNIHSLKWSNFACEPYAKVIKRLSNFYDYSSFHFYSRKNNSLLSRSIRKIRFELKLVKEKIQHYKARILPDSLRLYSR